MCLKISVVLLLLISAIGSKAQVPSSPSSEKIIQVQEPFVYPAASARPAPGPGLSAKSGHFESWTKLRLSDSHLNPADKGGVLLSNIEQPTYTRELLRVQWRPGDPIDLYVVRPRNVAKPPVILYLYNYTSDTDRFRDDGWCRRATNDGFAAVGFVSALSGQRFHAPRPMREWFVSELQEALATSTHDVQMVLEYLNARGDLDTTRIGMFGQGSGGAIAILASSVDPRISALDVIDPWGDWPDWIQSSQQIPGPERAAYLTPEFLQKVSKLDPLIYSKQLKALTFRLQQLGDDAVTPPAASQKLAAAFAGQGILVRNRDEDALREAWAVSGLSGWLREQLSKPSQNPQ